MGRLGVQGDDLLRGRLDERLRDLRVVQLLQVRVLMEKVPLAPSKKKLTGRQREALKRKRAESESEHLYMQKVDRHHSKPRYNARIQFTKYKNRHVL